MDAKGPRAWIDEEKVRYLIRWMVGKASDVGLLFRPHFKTHQSGPIGEWFREAGVEAVTVSSLRMAEYFLEWGWTDQTIAFPMDPRAVAAMSALAERANVRFTASEGTPLEAIDRKLTAPAGVMVELESGDRRSGFDPARTDLLDRAVETLDRCEKLHFEGFLTHSGHSYRARGDDGIQEVHERAMASVLPVKERYRSHRPLLSIGDTPTASRMEGFDGADELRPGNFVFFDLMQAEIGSCRVDDIAYCLECPIVAKHADRSELVVYGGAVHLSLDRLYMEDGTPFFGLPAPWEGKGWGTPYEGAWVKRLSQEHGVIRASPELFREKEVGETLAVLPVHSCLSADATAGFWTLDGDWVGKMG